MNIFSLNYRIHVEVSGTINVIFDPNDRLLGELIAHENLSHQAEDINPSNIRTTLGHLILDGN
jgi:hypothetical protein